MLVISSYIPAPRMIQLHIDIPQTLADPLEAYFCELEHSPWMLRDDRVKHRLELFGYFYSQDEADEAYGILQEAFPQLPMDPHFSKLEDRDWKEAYKEHFKPWSSGGLHWAPTWERERYRPPEGHKIIYLDPGMAFGTGNHETTRLCAHRLVEAAQDWGATLPDRAVVDAGCGSGILAISAAALGFGSVRGFDVDPDSVAIAEENAEENSLAAKVQFHIGSLEDSLGDQEADLVLANILADALTNFREELLCAVRPGGRIALSGILAKEVSDVRKAFEASAADLWGGFRTESRIDGEWADLLFFRPEAVKI